MKRKSKKTQTGFWDFLLDGLWADGILTFVMNARFWVLGAWVFVLVWTPLFYFSKDYTLGSSALQAPGGSFFAVAMFFVASAQVYFFTVCYLNQQPVTGGTLKLKSESFAHVVALLFFIALVFLLGWRAIAAGLAWLPGKALLRMPAGAILTAVMAVVILQLCVAVPLVVNRVKTPLLQAGRITAGKWWRLFWNALILCVMVVTPLVVFGAVLRGTAAGLHIALSGSVGGALFLSFVDSAVWVMIQGLVWAFFYSCCRSFYGEYVVAHLPADRRTARRS